MAKGGKVKILLAGDDTWPMYVNAFFQGFQKIESVEVHLFDLGKLNSGAARKQLWTRLENRFAIGPDVSVINHRLVRCVEEHKIEIVFIYSARVISWKTVRKLRTMGVKTAIYCNDNPFSDYFPFYFWRNIRKGVRFCDVAYSYRQGDISDYQKAGAENVKLLRSYYITDRNYRIENRKPSAFQVPEVVFLGHMEKDERIEYLDALLEQGIHLGVRGTPEWECFAKNRKNVTVFQETVRHYNEILNRTEIAVVFLSKINHDTYTRRCFEIPAAGTMMLAPYTKDLASLFEEGKEIVFYRSKEDFVQKAKYYLVHDDERRNIGLAGHRRVMRDGHSETDRVRQILEDMSSPFL